jgi:hypothetical protein
MSCANQDQKSNVFVMKQRRASSLYSNPSSYLQRKQKRAFWWAVVVGVLLSTIVGLF